MTRYSSDVDMPSSHVKAFGKVAAEHIAEYGEGCLDRKAAVAATAALAAVKSCT